MKTEFIEILKWMAERHITREYRTHVIGEDEAKQILALLENREANKARYGEPNPSEDYKRGYRDGYDRCDMEVRGAMA